MLEKVKKNQIFTKKNNFINQITFLNQIVKLGVKKIIFSSSYSAEGFNKNNSVNFSPYAKYKFLLEKYLETVSKNQNIKVIVLKDIPMWLDRAQMELWVKETIKLQEFFLPFLKILPKTKQQQFIMILKIKPFHLEIIFMSKILPD